MLTVMLLGVAHALVDASTVTAVMRASHSGPLAPAAAAAVVFGYDAIAFGSQVFFGWVTDRCATPRAATLLGLLLSGIALLLVPLDPFLTMACAGVGNAWFHLGAGATVLRGRLDRAAPAGLFVAPGALGLGFGLYYGATKAPGPLWPLLALLFLAAAGVALHSSTGGERVSTSAAPVKSGAIPTRTARLALTLLLVSIAVRSLVGLSAARGHARTELLLLGLPLAAFLGKLLGGYLADRIGWIEASVGALLLSIPAIALSVPLLGLLVGLFVFQLTMPVTLTAVARLLPNRLATAFGWTCFALLAGALPTMSPRASVLCTRPLLGIWIGIGALSLYSGLRLLGIGLRRTDPLPALTFNIGMKS